MLGRTSKSIDGKRPGKKKQKVNFDEEHDHTIWENGRAYSSTVMLLPAHPCFLYQEFENSIKFSKNRCAPQSTTVLIPEQPQDSRSPNFIKEPLASLFSKNGHAPVKHDCAPFHVKYFCVLIINRRGKWESVSFNHFTQGFLELRNAQWTIGVIILRVFDLFHFECYFVWCLDLMGSNTHKISIFLK